MKGSIRVLAAMLVFSPALAFPAADKGVPASSSPTFRDPITRDPMLAKSLSLLSPGMGHYYNGNYRKMRKYQRRMTLAHVPFAAGLAIDIGRNPLKNVDQFKDLSFKNFPWYGFAGLILSGILSERVRENDAEEAYTDALRLKMDFSEDANSPSPPSTRPD